MADWRAEKVGWREKNGEEGARGRGAKEAAGLRSKAGPEVGVAEEGNGEHVARHSAGGSAMIPSRHDGAGFGGGRRLPAKHESKEKHHPIFRMKKFCSLRKGDCIYGLLRFDKYPRSTAVAFKHIST